MDRSRANCSHGYAGSVADRLEDRERLGSDLQDLARLVESGQPEGEVRGSIQTVPMEDAYVDKLRGAATFRLTVSCLSRKMTAPTL